MAKRKQYEIIEIFAKKTLLKKVKNTWCEFGYNICIRMFFSGSVHCSRTRKYFFQQINFKFGSHGTSYTFKNYFVTVFLVFNFQFSTISDIQIDPYFLEKMNYFDIR